MARNPYAEYVEKSIHGLSRTEMQVMMKIAGFMRGDNARQCMDASLKTMEEWFCVERTTINRAIRSLQEKEMIMVFPSTGKTNKLMFAPLFWDAYDNQIDWVIKKRPSAKRSGGGCILPRHPGHFAPQQNNKYTERVSSNYNKPFPSLHYASLNLVAVPETLSANDVFPSGGVL